MTTADTANVARSNSAAEPGQYPVNLRITVPFPKPFFITLIIGPEKRGRDRLRVERERHPVNTWGNLAITIAAWTVITVAGLFTAFIVAGL